MDDKGYPERDNVPAAILTDLNEVEDATEDQYFARCCHFFEALFKTLQAKFEQAPQDVEPKSKYNRDWNDSMCTMGSESRAAFIDRVQAQYNEIRMRSGESPSKDREGEDPEVLSPSAAMVIAHENILRALQRIRKHKKGEHDLVMVFDEAHQLSRWQSPYTYQLSHVLCRAISDYSFLRYAPQSVWVVFVSTISKVTDFSPPRVMRYFQEGDILFSLPMSSLAGTITLLRRGTSPPRMSPEWVISSRLVDLCGPLYDVAPGGVDGVISLARGKLCNSSIFDANDPDQALAVLSQRFCLGVCLDHAEAVQYVDTAVASHLRVCTSITAEQKHTSYPSEPFLPCVAAGLMHRSPESLQNTLRVLVAKVDSGMLDIGEDGELASRLLWLLAKDLFVWTVFRADITGLCTGGDKPEFIDCSGVPVIDFLEHVLGDPFTKAVQNPAAKGGKEAFQGACINFSHWVTMEELIATQDREDWSLNDWTLRHYLRTSSVQCCQFQPLVDKMIPILFNDNEARDSDCVSRLFISDNTSKTKPNRGSLHDVRRTHPSIRCGNDRPWIAILNDLGMKQTACEVTYDKSDKCLRIYISGTNTTSYPWMTQYPSVLHTLRHLVVRQEEETSDDPIAGRLQSRAQFESTSLDARMRWESELVPNADDDSTPTTESIVLAAKDGSSADRKGKKRALEGETPTTVKKSKGAK
ncbi:hypothetical protein BJ138DRAFT_1119485 [Hygrophoropsis aurantiaca]|uniref:Uncharacterized protein n=1 Tax=Hygrophoropsis aurantiaca TaxID=72124 RepID=A0ACB7ZUG1_9AGAM|nr:hypothetical protein BJ138DRAFT_1119485 [Hygrophoropsis aurantiaca]